MSGFPRRLPPLSGKKLHERADPARDRRTLHAHRLDRHRGFGPVGEHAHQVATVPSRNWKKNCHQIARVLRAVDIEPLVAEEVVSLDLMLTLISAGYALALVGASQVSESTGIS